MTDRPPPSAFSCRPTAPATQVSQPWIKWVPCRRPARIATRPSAAPVRSRARAPPRSGALERPCPVPRAAKGRPLNVLIDRPPARHTVRTVTIHSVSMRAAGDPLRGRSGNCGGAPLAKSIAPFESRDAGRGAARERHPSSTTPARLVPISLLAQTPANSSGLPGCARASYEAALKVDQAQMRPPPSNSPIHITARLGRIGLRQWTRVTSSRLRSCRIRSSPAAADHRAVLHPAGRHPQVVKTSPRASMASCYDRDGKTRLATAPHDIDNQIDPTTGSVKCGPNSHEDRRFFRTSL